MSLANALVAIFFVELRIGPQGAPGYDELVRHSGAGFQQAEGVDQPLHVLAGVDVIQREDIGVFTRDAVTRGHVRNLRRREPLGELGGGRRVARL